MKRILCISDLHSGHWAGLSPPQWWKSESTAQGQQQRLCYDFYLSEIRRLRKHRPIDLVIIAGDCIDGKGKKSGSREQLTTDRHEQVEMAREAINEIQAGRIVITYGTPYHSGSDEKWEKVLAEELANDRGQRLGAKGCDVRISAQETVDVNGLIFDVKHKVGRSSIPHGKFTPLARTKIWDRIWAEVGQRPAADVILRGHVHYHCHCGTPEYLAMTLPALKGLGDEFGAEQCDDIIHFGLVWFDVKSKDDWCWQNSLLKWRTMPATVVKV